LLPEELIGIMNSSILNRLYNKTFKLFKWALLLSPFGLFAIICLDTYIIAETEKHTFHDINQIPYNKVGLLLGTAKHSNDGRINPYYQYRLNAAMDLYKAGKIDFILISDDNSKVDYDEPTDFKTDLVKLGFPEKKIFLDYAGFSTLDSVLRAQKIFGLDRFTIISQKFHNQRAIFLASQKKINTIGFNAKNVSGSYSLKTEMREYLTRTKAFLDILFNSQPKYLGEKIAIQ
jgi:SanA protein